MESRELTETTKARQPHIGNLAIITAKAGSELLLVHKPPENEGDKHRKRKRIGINKWVQPGGGVEESDLSIVDSVRRETKQETGLGFPVSAFTKVGILEGYVEGDTVNALWVVHIYKAAAWPDMYDKIRVNPKEHDAIRWFETRRIPWEGMIESDKLWLPRLLAGETLSILVVFKKDGEEMLSCHVEEAKFS